MDSDVNLRQRHSETDIHTVYPFTRTQEAQN